MDLFGKKQAALEKAIAAQRSTITRLENSELSLMADIREMDQLIFRMSQCDSWERMRPLFNELHAQTVLRMQAESDAMAEVLIPAMKKAYR